MERTALLDKVLDSYARWYDIVRCGEEEAPMMATAAFHERRSAYMISKKAEMWSANVHEYAYFFSLPVLTEENYDACFQKAYALGETLVDPNQPQHMNTNIVVFLLADKVEDAAALKVKKCRIRKNFQFGLKGWMEVHVVAVSAEAETAVANPAGRNEQTYLEKLMHPPKQTISMLNRLLRK